MDEDAPRPLADRLRPERIEDVVGQDHLIGPDGPIGRMLAQGRLASLILWGPPGVGKTTIARLLAERTGLDFQQISAIFSGVKDLRAAFDKAEALRRTGKGTLLFVDEIHRFNRAQQDGFLPFVERGVVTLIGATTENPSFELNGALLSRCQVMVLKRLDEAALALLAERAEKALGRPLPIMPDAREALIAMADGDGRYFLNLVEEVASWTPAKPLDAGQLLSALQKRAPAYDKNREEHYNLISAWHKATRGSDPDAALYWFCRMLEGGEDPLFLARRMIRAASEDVGLADPTALMICNEAAAAYERLGSPEGELALAQAVIHLATAPKSNAAYKAYNAARAAARETGSLAPPAHILNAPTKMMKSLGYGAGYEYDHDAANVGDGGGVSVSLPRRHGASGFYRPKGVRREAPSANGWKRSPNAPNVRAARIDPASRVQGLSLAQSASRSFTSASTALASFGVQGGDPMHRRLLALALAVAAGAAMEAPATAEPVREAPKVFTAADVFRMESADSPAISPDGKLIAYVRVAGDVMVDRFVGSIWLADADGKTHEPIAQGRGSYASPVWSPDGRSIAFIAAEDGGPELRVYNLDTRATATLTRLTGGARGLAWSPNGKTLAFSAFVEEAGASSAPLPPRPEGAKWNAPVKVFDTIDYHADGQGLLESGYMQIFVLPADGGTPRQLTWTATDQSGRLSWTPDGKSIVFSANREPDASYNPLDSDLQRLDVETGAITRLTADAGPEVSPAVSPNGKQIAYVGGGDNGASYQVGGLYVANIDGTQSRALTPDLDRDVANPQWVGDNEVWFLYEDGGETKVGRVSLRNGKVSTVVDGLAGRDLSRPYSGGAFSVSKTGKAAITRGDPQTPAELAVHDGKKVRVLTDLNSDVFTGRTISPAERITVPSSYDQRPIDAWIVRPPDFDPAKSYPLLLEIHGGPHSAYGPVFAAEIQMFAAAGYIVVYSNPRGSTSYGDEFGALISHNYPSQDYDDLMSVVDATIAKGSIDTSRLYVTGGSGGGVLTAWIVGKTDRFRAAMVQKPVINWTSEVLSADSPVYMSRYWFGTTPWEDHNLYWSHSPLSLVGNVVTPTAVLVGEEDNRTPRSEAQQYYAALQLRHVPSRLILVPGSSHDVGGRPTGMIAKVSNTITWFAKYGGPPLPDPVTGRAGAESADKSADAR
ncbi:MAG: prolyl oligopeptidase family serine peptidase [Hyphomonadaceae bacterium]